MIILNLEEEVFKKSHVLFAKLKPYGFLKNKDDYIYTKNFMNNQFTAQIFIDKQGKVSGKVYDLETKDEYPNIRLKHPGPFVISVQEAYKNILKDIKENCFEENFFVYDQTNRITEYIIKKYQTKPLFLWENAKNNAVFKNQYGKWFGLVVCIDKSKITKGEGNCEIIDLKLDNDTSKYLKHKGIYPAYHLNKQNWVSIILDGTLEDEKIQKLIDISYNLVNSKDYWIVPANPKYYDIITHFEHDKTINWKQSSSVHVKDIVYLYVGSPYSSVLYKCEVTEVNIPYAYQDENVSMKHTMHLKLLKKYEPGKISFKALNNLGIKAIRGPRKITEEIARKIDNN